MRVLFSSTGGDGHVLPLLPLAQAFRDRGDEVAVATGASSAHRVEGVGLPALAVGADIEDVEREWEPHRAELLQLPIPERRPFQFSRRFGRIEAPARIDDLRRRVHAFGADVLIHETAELAAPIVAAELGLPSVHHGFGRRMPSAVIAMTVPEVAPLWRAAGFEPDPHAGLFRGAYVDVSPPSLDPEPPPPGTTVLPRRIVDAAALPAEGRALIYVTVGTVLRNAELLRTLIAALADTDADVLVTTGAQNDGNLGPVPANTTVERFVPQAQVLPRASVVVTHAGSGSTLGALAHGLPLVALPHLADQFDNAAAVERAGAARVLLPEEITEAAVRTTVEGVLANDAYRTAARRIADEIAAMPSAAEVAQQIAELYVNGDRGARASSPS